MTIYEDDVDEGSDNDNDGLSTNDEGGVNSGDFGNDSEDNDNG